MHIWNAPSEGLSTKNRELPQAKSGVFDLKGFVASCYCFASVTPFRI